MALPSKVRPPELEQELAENVKSEKRPKLVFKITKDELFHSRLSDWFNNTLKGKEKKRITPLILKRQAIKICLEYSIDYGTLHQDWVTRFLTEFKVTLRERKEKEAEPSLLEAALIRKNRRRQTVEEAKAKLEDAKNKKLAEAEEKVGNDPEEKILLDLRFAPPPSDWLKKAADGNAPPRFLTTFKIDETTTIMYYDYNPKLKITDSQGRVTFIGVEDGPTGTARYGPF